MSSDTASGVCDIDARREADQTDHNDQGQRGRSDQGAHETFEKSDAYRARARAMDMTDARGNLINIYRLECAVERRRWRARWDAVRARVGVAETTRRERRASACYNLNFRDERGDFRLQRRYHGIRAHVRVEESALNVASSMTLTIFLHGRRRSSPEDAGEIQRRPLL